MAKSKSKSRAKVMLLSCMTIMMCVATITAGTFALFTDNVTIHNHLQAGTLDARLARTNLVYALPDADGILDLDNPTTVTTRLELDGTTTADSNVFGMSDGEHFIVPGCFFEATLELKNEGNVAFDYGIKIDFQSGMDTELAQQLKVTVTPHVGQAKSAYASAGGSLEIEAGEAVKKSDGAISFKVRVEFEDKNDGSNNDAMGDLVKFDLIVTAIQSIAD